MPKKKEFDEKRVVGQQTFLFPTGLQPAAALLKRIKKVTQFSKHAQSTLYLQILPLAAIGGQHQVNIFTTESFA